MAQSIRGIPWYHEADYNGLLEMFEDRKLLLPTFQQWLQATESLLKYLEGEGMTIEKVYITPENFLPWCHERGLRLNNHSRDQFVEFIIASRNMNTGSE
jgi:hypothetical protein